MRGVECSMRGEMQELVLAQPPILNHGEIGCKAGKEQGVRRRDRQNGIGGQTGIRQTREMS